MKLWPNKKKTDSILLSVEKSGALTREYENLERKVLKTAEEVGELSEAIMGVTSETNYKNKNWEDVLEEAVDVAIMGLDIALTVPPTECSPSCHEVLHKFPTHEDVKRRRQKVQEMFEKKLRIWEEQIESKKSVIGD